MRSLGLFFKTFFNFLFFGIIVIFFFVVVFFGINYKKQPSIKTLTENVEGVLIPISSFYSNEEIVKYSIGEYEDLFLYVDYKNKEILLIEEFNDFEANYVICFGAAKSEEIGIPIQISNDLNYVIFKGNLVLELEKFNNQLKNKDMQEIAYQQKNLKNLIEIK